jgi:MSHA biogenesis protein MshJ
MSNYIQSIRSFYDTLKLREQLLALLLVWAFLYAIFAYILYRPIDADISILQADIKTLNEQQVNWNNQIDMLKKISKTPLYDKWIKQHKAFQKLQSQYKLLLQNSSSKQWQEFIKTILRSQNNITLEQIKDFPEAVYNPTNTPNLVEQIYQQHLTLIINSNYFDTIAYIKELEKSLPNILWDTLTYQVTQYPIGKVELGFSILYEKNDD